MKKAEAIKHFESAANLARALGISRSAVSGWREHVPPRRAYEIEKLTGGKLKAPPINSESHVTG